MASSTWKQKLALQDRLQRVEARRADEKKKKKKKNVAAIAGSSGKTIEDAYRSKDMRQQIYDDPGMWTGGIDRQTDQHWLLNEDKTCIERESVTYCDCLDKCFDELIVNCVDHYKRLEDLVSSSENVKPVTKIKVDFSVTDTEAEVVVENNGDGIDVCVHGETGIYVPEMIFGHLMTSTNYDKSETDSTVGGKHGVGAKLANIFASEFTVETVDHRRKKKYVQTFRDNMTVIEPPKITSCSKAPYTKFTWKPDLARFGVTNPRTELAGDWRIMERRVYDAAANTGKQVRVTLNSNPVPIRTFKDYVDLFIGSKRAGGLKRVFSFAHPCWEIAACVTETGEFQQISFVNGIFTDYGGRHVDHVLSSIVSSLQQQQKDKKAVVPPVRVLKRNLMLFIRATITRPDFDSQTKRRMTKMVDGFGSRCVLEDAFAPGLIRIGLLKLASEHVDAKAAKKFERETDGNARARHVHHPQLVDAAAAGRKTRKKCTTLGLTEGASASSFFATGLRGIPKEEHQYWGYFALRGKPINPLTSSDEQVRNNKELIVIKQVMGLKQGMVYKDTKDLRYDRLMILTDADKDGHHIKGLVINLLHKFWPSLLKLPGFVCSMQTPILRVSFTRGAPLDFFTERAYENWDNQEEYEKQRGKIKRIKYFKGLGTYEDTEKIELCKRMKILSYEWTENTPEMLDLAFHGDFADARKQWIQEALNPQQHKRDAADDDRRREHEEELKDRETYPAFINESLRLYSISDNVRSIPHVIDGLKPSQRKILFACFMRNLTESKCIKVAQLSGYVSEKSQYHHGEKSLSMAIIGLAQNYVGANNINLLYPSGTFGTRLGDTTTTSPGGDAGAERYIFTYLSPIVTEGGLFHQDDNGLVPQQVEEGVPIEPEYYAPSIPLILVNGANGIGTGFSTLIPMYSVDRIVQALRLLMQSRGNVTNDELTQVVGVPFYKGFKGTIEPDPKDMKRGILSHGCYERTGDTTILVTELPVNAKNNVSYRAYNEFLIACIEATKESLSPAGPSKRTLTPKRLGITNYDILTATDTVYNVCITFKSKEYLDWLLEEYAGKANAWKFEMTMKLTTSCKLTNMHAYDASGKIKHYENTGQIVRDFFDVRVQLYEKRLHVQKSDIEHKLTIARERYRFIVEIMDKVLVLDRLPKCKAVDLLRQRKYTPIVAAHDKKNAKADDNSDEDEDEDEERSSSLAMYDHLLSMKVVNFTKEKLQKLQKRIKALDETLCLLAKETALSVWDKDLNTVSTYWKQLLEQTEATLLASSSTKQEQGTKKKQRRKKKAP